MSSALGVGESGSAAVPDARTCAQALAYRLLLGGGGGRRWRSAFVSSSLAAGAWGMGLMVVGATICS
jgi:hypothetical protein